MPGVVTSGVCAVDGGEALVGALARLLPASIDDAWRGSRAEAALAGLRVFTRRGFGAALPRGIGAARPGTLSTAAGWGAAALPC